MQIAIETIINELDVLREDTIYDVNGGWIDDNIVKVRLQSQVATLSMVVGMLKNLDSDGNNGNIKHKQ